MLKSTWLHLPYNKQYDSPKIFLEHTHIYSCVYAAMLSSQVIGLYINILIIQFFLELYSKLGIII